MRYREVIGLDCDGESIYLAQVQLTREGPVLQSTRTAETIGAPGVLPDYSHSLKEYAPAGPRAAAAAVRRGGAAQCLLDLPPLGPEATALAAAAALEDKVAYPASEMSVGFARLGRGGMVRAVGVRRALVEEERAALAAAGYAPARVELRPLAAATAFWYCHGAELAEPCAILVELREEESSAVFLRQGEVLYSRSLPGLGGSGDRQTALAEIAAELRVTYPILSASSGWTAPACLWLTGAGAVSAETRAALADLLGLAPDACRIARPAGLLRLATVAEPGPEMLVPIGLCLASLGVLALGPDLLPGLGQTTKTTHAFLQAALPLGLTLILVCTGLRFLAGAANRQAAADEAWLAAHRQEADALAVLQEESASLAERLDRLARFGEGSAACLELLLALEKTLPDGTRLTRLSVAGNRVETLGGITPSASALLRRLKSSPTLSQLALRGQAVRKTENGQVMEVFALVGPFGQGGAD